MMNRKQRSHRVEILVVAALILVGPTCAWALSGAPVGIGATPAPLGGGILTRYHPGIDPETPDFHLANANPNSMPTGWETVRPDLVSPFSKEVGGVVLAGTITTRLWRWTADGHLMFTYQVTNSASSGTEINHANLVFIDSGVTVLDSGILAPGRGTGDTSATGAATDTSVHTGDIVQLSRTPGVLGDTLRFDWLTGNHFDFGLLPSQASTFFFIETDQPWYMRGRAAILDSGITADDIPVLVPSSLVPEPLTALAVFAGVGGIGTYLRKRLGR